MFLPPSFYQPNLQQHEYEHRAPTIEEQLSRLHIMKIQNDILKQKSHVINFRKSIPPIDEQRQRRQDMIEYMREHPDFKEFIQNKYEMPKPEYTDDSEFQYVYEYADEVMEQKINDLVYDLKYKFIGLGFASGLGIFFFRHYFMKRSYRILSYIGVFGAMGIVAIQQRFKAISKSGFQDYYVKSTNFKQTQQKLENAKFVDYPLFLYGKEIESLLEQLRQSQQHSEELNKTNKNL
eukprot:403373162